MAGAGWERPAPPVTVCIFTRNRADYLRLAVEAALAQTFEDFELLVMDNASQDGTPALMASFQDPRIRYHRHPYDRGAAVSYRLALSKARGTYLLLTHDDDVMAPTLVARQVEALRADPGLYAVTTNVSVIGPQGECLKERRHNGVDDLRFDPGGYLETWLDHQMWLPFPTLMIRRPFLPRLFVPKIWEGIGPLADIHATCRLNLRHRILYLADPLLANRQHAEQSQFHYSQVGSAVRLHRWMADALRSPGLRHLLPKAQTMLLRYRCQQDIVSATTRAALPRLRSTLARRFKSARRALERRPSGQEQPGPSSPSLTPCQLAILARLMDLHGPGPEPTPPPGPFGAWLSHLKAKRHLCEGLQASGVRKVAILGSLLNGFMLGLDAARSGLEVVAYLDSNHLRQKFRLGGTPILPPTWLAQPPADLDAVLISSEQDRDEAIQKWLRTQLPPDRAIPVLSWKSLHRS